MLTILLMGLVFALLGWYLFGKGRWDRVVIVVLYALLGLVAGYAVAIAIGSFTPYQVEKTLVSQKELLPVDERFFITIVKDGSLSKYLIYYEQDGSVRADMFRTDSIYLETKSRAVMSVYVEEWHFAESTWRKLFGLRLSRDTDKMTKYEISVPPGSILKAE